MKKTIYSLILPSFIILFFFISCSKKDAEIENSSLNESLSINKKVALLGFDTTGIAISGDTIIVEGDIIIIKSELIKTSPRHASSIDITQGNAIYPITYSKHRNLKYHIAPTVSSWESAIQTAFLHYNNLGYFNLRFQRTTNINEADMRIEDGSNAVADANFPKLGQLGNRIRINTISYGNSSESQKVYALVHEIGHTIGLRHTNWRGDKEFQDLISNEGYHVGAYTVPGTPNSSNNPDPNSVYNSGKLSTQIPNWNNFSSFDVTALVALYPSFGPAELYTYPTGEYPVYVGTKISSTITLPYWREGGLTYTWSTQGATITSINGTKMEATVTNPNAAGVHCKITNQYGQAIIISKSFGSIEID